MSSDPYVPVPIGACLCPGAPHEDGDVVYLRAKLGLAAGIAIQKLIIDANRGQGGMSEAVATGVLAEAYLLHGVAEWNLHDEGGPTAVTATTIAAHLLDDFSRGAPVAEIADNLYMAPVLAPLLKKAGVSSSTTSSNGSTSVTRTGTAKRQKQSKRSSTTTSPMGDIAPISASPVGDSNS